MSKPAAFTAAVFSQIFSSETLPAEAARTDIFFSISTMYLRCLQRSSLKMVFSPRCKIPQPQKLYRAQHCGWWSSEWHREGEQLWGLPGWRWSPSGNTHTTVQKAGNNFMLTHTWQATRGTFPFLHLVLFHCVSFNWHTALQTLLAVKISFSINIFTALCNFICCLSLGSYCNCRYNKRIKHLTNTDNKVYIEYKPVAWEQQKEQLCALTTRILPKSFISLIWFSPAATRLSTRASLPPSENISQTLVVLTADKCWPMDFPAWFHPITLNR